TPALSRRRSSATRNGDGGSGRRIFVSRPLACVPGASIAHGIPSASLSGKGFLMTRRGRLLLILALLVSTWSAPSIARADERASALGTILPLEVTEGARSIRGECFLVYQASVHGEMTRYFLTFAPLVTTETARVRVSPIGGEPAIEVSAQDILLPHPRW